jgi:hypothetical protein
VTSFVPTVKRQPLATAASRQGKAGTPAELQRESANALTQPSSGTPPHETAPCENASVGPEPGDRKSGRAPLPPSPAWTPKRCRHAGSCFGLCPRPSCLWFSSGFASSCCTVFLESQIWSS